MKTALTAFTITTIGMLSGCATVSLAPGAEQVKITSNAPDVKGCQAVGNIGPIPASPDTNAEMRNTALGMGGNVVFLTSVFGIEGVAYHCP